VAVIGCGHVGAHLARRLAAAGAQLVLADIDPAKRELLDDLAGAEWLDPAQALTAEVDIVAPCALGGVIDAAAAGHLRCAVVCGAANNQLAHDELAEDLAARAILYAPDFVVNSGGLINISIELEGYDPVRAHQGVEEIEMLVGRVLAVARSANTTPLAAAGRLARQRLDAPRAQAGTGWQPPPPAA
jgi:leucine dehydrogenase